MRRSRIHLALASLCLPSIQHAAGFNALFQPAHRLTGTSSPLNANLATGKGRFSYRIKGISNEGISNEQTSSFDDHQVQDNAVLEQLENSSEVGTSSSKSLLMACLLLAMAQLSGTQDATSANGIAFSAVSASLLKRNSKANLKSALTQIATLAFVAWQIMVQARSIAPIVASALSNMSAFYLSCLATFPLYTKSVSSGLIGFIGDAAAQHIEERIRIKKEGRGSTPVKYDRRRAASIVVDGLLITGPFLHVAYNYLEKMIPISGSTLSPSLAAISQVLIDDIFVDALFVALTYVSTGIAEGHGLKTLTHFKKDFPRTVKAGWATSVMLMPLEFACFRFLPLSLRVLGMNFIDIIWDGMLSFQVHKCRAANLKMEEAMEVTSTVRCGDELAYAAQ